MLRERSTLADPSPSRPEPNVPNSNGLDEADGAPDQPADDADTIIDNLAPVIPPELRPEVDMIVHQTVAEIATHRSGPLPDARELDAYKRIDASFAERIMQMAEREQEQRHRRANVHVDREYRLKSRGQHYALLAAAAILAFATLLAVQGDTKIAGYVVIATLASVVGIFLTGRVIEARASHPEIADDGTD